MRFLLLRVFLPALGFGLAWVFAGSRIASLLDRLSTQQSGDLEASYTSLSPQRFCVGENCYFVPDSLVFAANSASLLEISWQGKSIALGPVKLCQGKHYEFNPSLGDRVSFTQLYSRLPWPTPFEFSLFSIPMTSWRRHSYRRLLWQKTNGSTLEVIWPDEQGFYKSLGWRFGNVPFPPSIKIQTKA